MLAPGRGHLRRREETCGALGSPCRRICDWLGSGVLGFRSAGRCGLGMVSMRALAVVVIATLPTVLGLLAPTSISNLLNGADAFGDLRLLTDSAWERDGGYRRYLAVGACVVEGRESTLLGHSASHSERLFL